MYRRDTRRKASGNNQVVPLPATQFWRRKNGLPCIGAIHGGTPLPTAKSTSDLQHSTGSGKAARRVSGRYTAERVPCLASPLLTELFFLGFNTSALNLPGNESNRRLQKPSLKYCCNKFKNVANANSFVSFCSVVAHGKYNHKILTATCLSALLAKLWQFRVCAE